MPETNNLFTPEGATLWSSISMPTAEQLTMEELEAVYGSMRVGEHRPGHARTNAMLDGWFEIEAGLNDPSRAPLVETATEHLQHAAELSNPNVSLTDETYRRAQLGLAFLPIFEARRQMRPYAVTEFRAAYQGVGRLISSALAPPRATIDYGALSELVVFGTFLRAGRPKTIDPGSPREASSRSGKGSNHDGYILLPSGEKFATEVKFLGHGPSLQEGSTLRVGHKIQEAYEGRSLKIDRLDRAKVQIRTADYARLLLRESQGERLSENEHLRIGAVTARLRQKIVEDYLLPTREHQTIRLAKKATQKQ